jgi:O-antigen/teichoic acid export membrane protein
VLRRFLREGSIYALSNVLTRGIALLLVPLYTRVFGPAELGALDLLVLLGNLCNMVLVLEVSQAVARFYPSAAGDHERAAYASTGLWFTVGAYTAALIAAFLAAETLAHGLLDGAVSAEALRIALPALWANGILYFVQTLLRWKLMPREYALTSLMYAVVSAAVAVVLIVVAEMGVVAVFWGQIAGALLACTRALKAAGPALRMGIDGTRLKQMLAFSAPLVVSSAAVLATGYADRFVIKEYLSMADLGIYSVAQRLAGAVSLVLVGFQSAITPLVTHFAATPAAHDELARVFRYFLAIALPALLGLALFGRELLHLVATPIYYPAHSLVPLLGLAVLLAGMYVFAPGLWLARRTRTTMLVNLVAAAIAVNLNLLLVPSLGLAGAAMAAVTSAAFAFAACAVLGQRHFPLTVPWIRLAPCMPVLAGLAWLGSTLGDPSPAATAVRALMQATGTVTLVLLLVGPAELRGMLSRRRGGR